MSNRGKRRDGDNLGPSESNMIKMRLVRLLSHAKKYIAYNVLWQWAALMLQAGVIFAVTDLLAQALSGRWETAEITGRFLFLPAALAGRFLCDRMASRASWYASVDVKKILREKIYEKIMALGASYKEYIATSEVVQMSGEGVEQLEIYFGKYLPQLFYSLLAPVTLFLILSRISLKASVILLICVPLIPLSIVAVQKIAGRLFRRYWGYYSNLGDVFLENLQGLTTLKIYQADERKAEQMDEASENFRKITMKVLTMQLNSTSVMDIIAYGGAAVGMAAPLASEEALQESLRRVNLWEFLKSREGLLTKVAERGSNFSGGQCQRLVLARALLHNTPVYIFDEATSNIDVESEEMIMQVIRGLSKEKTVLLISHRLSNVVGSDCIYMMEKGKIIESGSHGELMALGGAYCSLYTSQRELEQYGQKADKSSGEETKSAVEKNHMQEKGGADCGE